MAQKRFSDRVQWSTQKSTHGMLIFHLLTSFLQQTQAYLLSYHCLPLDCMVVETSEESRSKSFEAACQL